MIWSFDLLYIYIFSLKAFDLFIYHDLLTIFNASGLHLICMWKRHDHLLMGVYTSLNICMEQACKLNTHAHVEQLYSIDKHGLFIHHKIRVQELADKIFRIPAFSRPFIAYVR
jgi:hypothetical protein